MSDKPLWYTQLKWSRPLVAVNALPKVPEQPGCYVFTADPGPLVPGRVLYVDKADNLKTRPRGYLVDFMKTAATKHKGRAFLFHHRHEHGEQSLYLRWAIYGDPSGIEGGSFDPKLRPS